MSFLKQMPHWLLADIILLVLALFFKFAMRGYGYIAFALIYAAALVTLCRFAPDALWKAAVIVTTVGLMYFFAVEGLIIVSARTDRNAGEKKYIVVLGAAVLDDRPSLALIHRMEGAMKYLDANPGSTAILCGGQGNGESMTEADCMYGWLTAQGVAPDRLIKEDRSTTTMENLQNAFDISRAAATRPTVASPSYPAATISTVPSAWQSSSARRPPVSRAALAIRYIPSTALSARPSASRTYGCLVNNYVNQVM